MLILPLQVAGTAIQSLINHANSNMNIDFHLNATVAEYAGILYNYTDRVISFVVIPDKVGLEHYTRFSFKLSFSEQVLSLNTGREIYVCNIPHQEDTLVDSINHLEFACTWALTDAMFKVINLTQAQLTRNILYRCGIDFHTKRDIFDYINEVNLRRDYPYDAADMVTEIETRLEDMNPPRKFRDQYGIDQSIVIDFTPQTEGT